MLFIVRTGNEFYGRTVMSFSHSRAHLFFDIAKLLEEKLKRPCGLTDYSSLDEYGVNPSEFIKFFEHFMSYVWESEGIEHLYNWAEHAAGIIKNITLEPRFWKHRHGPALFPMRITLSDDAEAELRKREEEFRIRTKKLPAGPHPAFDQLKFEDYADLIENAKLKT